MTKHTKKGFTLIELLVVIAIIGLLSSVVLASLTSARVKARDAKRLSDLRNLDLAIKLYRDNSSTDKYPICSDLPISNTSCLGLALIGARVMSTIPSDPINSGANRYEYWSGGTAFSIRTRLEGKPLRFSHTYPSSRTPASCDGISLIPSLDTTQPWYNESVYPNGDDCTLQYVQHSTLPD